MTGALVATHVHLPAFNRNRWVWKAYWWYFGNDLLEDKHAFLDLASDRRRVSRNRNTHYEPYFSILCTSCPHWRNNFSALGELTHSVDWVFDIGRADSVNYSSNYEKVSI